MKRVLVISLFVFGALSLVSCDKDLYSSILVKAVYNNSVASGAQITIINDTTNNKKLSYNKTSGVDANGEAFFSQLTAGNYIISSSDQINSVTVHCDTLLTFGISTYYHITVNLR
jgi:hypothetical protein